MRLIAVVAVVLLLGGPAQAGSRCDAELPRGPVGLPGSVFIKGACGTFALRPSGDVEPVHPAAWAPSWAKSALARADDRTYIEHLRGHLVLVRDARILWRSHLRHGSDDVVVHGEEIAFTAYGHRPDPDLWLAKVGAPEHLVARGEDLLGWARADGFFTERGWRLRLRDADGALTRSLARVSGTAYDRNTRTLVALTSSRLLIRTDGRRTTTLASFRQARALSLDLLPNGLIEVQSARRLFLLLPDGTRFASAALAPPTSREVSATVPLPRRRGVVFVVDRNGSDRVLLLERGGRVPRLLYERRTQDPGCGYGVTLSLQGDQALYFPSGGRSLVAFDTLGRRNARNLWPLVHRIPGFRGHGRIYRAAWASAWNR
jgi:hypothetical protein